MSAKKDKANSSPPLKRAPSNGPAPLPGIIIELTIEEQESWRKILLDFDDIQQEQMKITARLHRNQAMRAELWQKFTARTGIRAIELDQNKIGPTTVTTIDSRSITTPQGVRQGEQQKHERKQ